jgi:hypothetical protein
MRMTLAEWAKQPDRPIGGELIDGLMSKAATLVLGKPDAGKSLMLTNIVVGLIRGDKMILGQENLRPERGLRVMWALTDPGAVVELEERLDTLGATDVKEHLTFDDLSGVDRFSHPSYAAWSAEIAEEKYDLVIFDNLRGRAVGDLNKAEAAQPILHALTDIFTKSDSKTAVTLVAHTGLRDPRRVVGDNGPGAWARRWVSVTSSKDETRMIVTGGKSPKTLSLRCGIEPNGSFQLLSDPTASGDARAAKPGQKRSRGIRGLTADQAVWHVQSLPLDARRSCPKAAEALISAGIVTGTKAAVAQALLRMTHKGPLCWTTDAQGMYLDTRQPA